MAKCITVKQPWASLIVHGIKDIENRTWKTNFRGRVLVHSSMKIADYDFTQPQYQRLGELHIRRSYDHELKLKTGLILGSVEIVDCVINHPSIWAEKTIDGNKPIYNWVLANPILFDKLIPAKGKLSFWDFEIPETFQK